MAVLAASTEPDVDLARLVNAAGGGDRQAWEDLFARFSGLVFAVTRAYRLRPADAADVSQTTWLRFIENLPRIRQPERAGPWLAVTARRECLRVLRRAGRELPIGDDTALEPPGRIEHSPDEGILDSERQADFRRAFGCLSCRCQSLLRLLMAEPSLSYEEISAALAMPIGSIGPTRGRCLERLRQHVGEADSTYQDDGRPLVVR